MELYKKYVRIPTRLGVEVTFVYSLNDSGGVGKRELNIVAFDCTAIEIFIS